MKTTIISSKELGINCWSSDRIFKQCGKCSRVQNCKLKEAKDGRIKIAQNRVELKQAELKIAIEQLDIEKAFEQT